MKKKFVFAFAVAAMFTACSDNPSSAEDNKSLGNSISAEGHKYTSAYRFTDNLLIYPWSCVYHHPGIFAWEETAGDTSSYKIEGDSLWIGPSPSEYDPENHYNNRERLAISNNHDGLIGTWKMTDCERNISTQVIECDHFINGLNGIAFDMIFTQDSVTNITKLDSASLLERFKVIEPYRFVGQMFSFHIGNETADSLVQAKQIEVLDYENIRINNQLFTLTDLSHFDATGMNYVSVYTSDGKSCTKIESLGHVNKEQCLEGNEELLLSARDHSDEEYLYKEGPINVFIYNNNEEFKKCMYSLLTSETLEFLNANASYEGE